MALARSNRQSPQQRRALAAEIAEALRYLGGSAHRDRVIEFVGAMRRSRGRHVDPGMTYELSVAFEAYCDHGRRTGQRSALFTLPFGPGSLRWALADPDLSPRGTERHLHAAAG